MKRLLIVKDGETLGSPEMLPALERWLWKELTRLQGQEQRRQRPGAIIGCPLWGEKYVERFKRWCIPSLLSNRNAETLRHTDSQIVIMTDDDGFKRLWPTIRMIESLTGIRVLTMKIPRGVIEGVASHPNNKYWLLGMAQNILVRMAARSGQGFHMLMPDHIYADDYWGSLFRFAKDFDAIAQNGTSTDLPRAEKELETYRNGNMLTVPAIDLGDIGWRYLHKQMRMYTMNGRSNYPNSHFMMWQGEHSLWIYSPHANAAWMSNKLCLRAPIYGPAPMDTALPMFMPSGGYLPGMGDGIVFIEVSDAEKLHTRRVNETEFLVRCWSTVEWSEAYLPWFRSPTCVPIRKHRGFMPDEDIKAHHGRIYTRLVATGPKLKAGLEKAVAANDETADFEAILQAAD